MKILMVADSKSVFNQNFIKNVFSFADKTDIEIDLYEKGKYRYTAEKDLYRQIYKNNFIPNFVFRNPLFRKLFGKIKQVYDFSRINTCYDICHIQAWTSNLEYLTKHNKKIAGKLILTIWGSDFYARKKRKYDRQRNKLLKYIDVFTFSNSQTKTDFEAYYQVKKKTCINRWGLNLLDTIDELRTVNRDDLLNKWRLPKDKLFITVGTNGVKFQQQIPALESIYTYYNGFPENFHFIFPLTYLVSPGSTRQLKRYLAQHRINYTLIEDFLTDDEIARIRLLTDILIQVQARDALSGAMQEHLYAGSLVITGNWLPYQVFDEQGIYYFKIAKVGDVGCRLDTLVKNFELHRSEAKKNKEIIRKLSAIENTALQWIKTYQEVIN
jgi:hypothetical protein